MGMVMISKATVLRDETWRRGLGRACMLALVVLLTFSSAGCIETVILPIAKTPVMLVDYSDNVTKMYIIGFEDTKYDLVTINVTSADGFFQQNVTNTYVWSGSSAATNFTFYASATYRTYRYSLNGTISIEWALPEDILPTEPQEPVLEMRIWWGETDWDEYQTYGEDVLPVKVTMERMPDVPLEERKTGILWGQTETILSSVAIILLVAFLVLMAIKMKREGEDISLQRIRPRTIISLFVFAVIGALIMVLTLTGLITFGNILTNFMSFVLAIVVVSILAVIGALFIGMAITHRITANRGFSPFEEEMLRMRVDIEKLGKSVQSLVDVIEAREGLGAEGQGTDKETKAPEKPIGEEG
ncbi:MAG: hypothetical protein QCI38_08520 [Candidatus Thermoplasmatota archaeon]|nr:hypothetical protein [Candidatus Thermoplasmatota archaeon]